MHYRFDISYVITTKNEEKNLGNILLSIVNQNKQIFSKEIIVIDNKSTDSTKKIAESFSCAYHNVNQDKDVRNLQRNLGLIEKSRGKYIFWLDADMILSPNLSYDCFSLLENNSKLKGLYIPEVILGKDVFAISRRFERFFYENTPIDGLRFFNKEAFESIGGFTQDWMHGPDDWDLDIRFKSKFDTDIVKTSCEKFESKVLEKIVQNKLYINYLKYPTCIFHNESQLTINKFINKKSHYYKDFKHYVERWGRNHPSLKKQLGIFYRTIGIFFRSWKISLKTIKNFHLYILFLVIRMYIYVRLILKIKI